MFKISAQNYNDPSAELGCNGLLRLCWRTSDKTCPYCHPINSITAMKCDQS